MARLCGILTTTPAGQKNTVNELLKEAVEYGRQKGGYRSEAGTAETALAEGRRKQKNAPQTRPGAHTGRTQGDLRCWLCPKTEAVSPSLTCGSDMVKG